MSCSTAVIARSRFPLQREVRYPPGGMDEDIGTSRSATTGPTARPPPDIPAHKVLRKIGGGSYGEVWLARTVNDIYRAVKVVYRSSFSEERPYLREFDGVRQFEPISRKNKGLVEVLQVDRPEGADFFYYVMELADDANSEFGLPEAQLCGGEAPSGGGRNLASRSAAVDLRRRSIDPDNYTPKTLKTVLRRADHLTHSKGDGEPHFGLSGVRCLDVASELAAGLKFLHEQGLVHRHIKPSNIVFVNGSPKLADIGLVAAAGNELSVVGTEGYMAPEGPGGPQADIFALGKVIYDPV
jgi:eukaryotic-like serine/threonine-protein kinase